MTLEEAISLCWTFSDDPATRHTMRYVVIPRLERRAGEYRAIRLSLRDRVHRETWAEAGFDEEEARLRMAIRAARSRLDSNVESAA